MIAAFSMAFLAYASPLAGANEYIWTTPNMPSNIAGVVGGLFARTEDVAYIHEAIAERRVLGGGNSGASSLPVNVLRAADLPLTPAQALANGWQIVSTGIVDGVANVLTYRETVTNWPKAGGIDTWRMRPVTFELPGGWLDPSNDVTSLHAAVVPYPHIYGDIYTNCFGVWRGELAATNMTLSGLAWRPGLTNILHRLAGYRLHPYYGNVTNTTAIVKNVVSDPYVSTSTDGKSISVVQDGYTSISTNTTGGGYSADFGFSAYRSTRKHFQFYYDSGIGTYVQCGGSPLSYTYSNVYSLIGSVGGQDIAVVSAPTTEIFSTGGVQRITGVAAIAIVSMDYEHIRAYEGASYETVSATNLYAAIPVAASLAGEDAGRPLVRITSSPAAIVAAAIAAANLPASDSGFVPPVPEGTLNDDGTLENTEREALEVFFQGYMVIFTIKPLTTIEELQ